MRILRLFATLLVAMLLSGLLPAEPVQAATARQPVIFVHGLSSTGSIWNSAVAQYRNAGYASTELYVFDYNWAQSNATTASQFASFVDSVRSRTGWSRVDVVTHSMGGLSTRWCIKFGTCGGKIDDWVSIGGPNHGTDSAGWCYLLFTSCREMTPGSSFLSRINASPETTSGALSWTTFGSPCDLIINPDSSVRLSGASNRQTACLEHISMASNSTVIANTIAVVR